VLTTEAMRSASNRFWLSAHTEPSVPSPTATPRSSSSRTGAMPQPSRRLLPGLCATAPPASASIFMSSSDSHTPCAPTKPGPSRPCAASRPTIVVPQRRRLSMTCTLDSARCVCTPTPYSRARRAQPSRNSSVAWLGMVGATATRTRPSAAPLKRRMARSISSSSPLVGAGRIDSTLARRSAGSRSTSPGTVWKNTTSATAGASTTRTPTSVYARTVASKASSVMAGTAMYRS